MSTRDVVLCPPVRTAIGTYNGTLKDTPATELGAAVVRETLQRRGSRQEGSERRDGQRHPGGQPDEPGAASRHQRRRSGRGAGDDGQPRLRLRRAGDRLGRAGDLARAYRRRDRRRHGEHGHGAVPDAGGRWGYRMGDAQIYDSMLHDGLNDAFSGEHSGWHTEDLVSQHRSRARTRTAGRAIAAAVRYGTGGGKFDGEIVPVEIKSRKGPESFAKDEPIVRTRPGGARQAEAGVSQGRHDHRGQCTGPQQRRGRDDRRRARIRRERTACSRCARLVAYGVGAVEPGMFGIGPVPAVSQALERARWTLTTSTGWRSTRRSRPSRLRSCASSDSPEDIVNVEGGAIAHGHPIGATGAVLTTRLLHSMQRDGLKRGIVTLCIGGGQGIALSPRNGLSAHVGLRLGLTAGSPMPASASACRYCDNRYFTTTGLERPPWGWGLVLAAR